ncbi:hypothetical protein [Proteiniborus sp. MB09-C3]|uniref:hypothetical protein n=1 Tax=Proteiniborus sp. MB09-C3 TaxID=3050072 RepID=UPI002555D956|nr:hypothetical protein [Proteiniborus sp. MB09-C3]WIV10544.1 hypothetical protein QO263_10270 [Proteiniborus sp. MB09-C3]
MVNIEVKEFKIKISKKVYTFRLDFRALLKFNNKYENGMEIFNLFLQGKNSYDCVVKILSCACIEKEWTEEELASKLSFDFETMRLIDDIMFTLAEGLLVKNEDKIEEGNEEKN